MIVKKLVGIAFFVLGVIVLILGYKLYDERNLFTERELKYKDTEAQYEVTQKTLLGYTSFKNYSAVLSKSLSEQMKFIGAKVNRRYMHDEVIKDVTLKMQSFAAIELIYDAEYVVGYDLSHEKFKLEATSKGFVLHLNKPEIVASPAATYTFTRILYGALLIDANTATINLLNKLPQILGAPDRINGILHDEAVIALCEKKIKEFIRSILVSQYKIDMIPEIRIIYTN
jgi:hypothetical protein